MDSDCRLQVSLDPSIAQFMGHGFFDCALYAKSFYPNCHSEIMCKAG